MCGIVGLHLKDPSLQPRLGALLVPMLTALAPRGPDSAGIALYSDEFPEPEHLRVYKDVGHPAAICERYRIAEAAGYQGVGHTRMATESAVTTAHSHPFAPGGGLTLVHNGSFSNHATIRRRLLDQGVRFDSDNDSEVAARYLAWRLAAGDDLGDGLRMVLKEFDGFFTLLVATPTQFAVVRDAFACKPAVIAETPGYVAMASEYHALAGLPGIEAARVFEPMPEEIHLWTR